MHDSRDRERGRAAPVVPVRGLIYMNSPQSAMCLHSNDDHTQDESMEYVEINLRKACREQSAGVNGQLWPHVVAPACCNISFSPSAWCLTENWCSEGHICTFFGANVL